MAEDPEAQRARVRAMIEEREALALKTGAKIEALPVWYQNDPLEGISQDVRNAVEEEYHTAKGRQRYQTSDGRVLWLTPEQVEARRRARDKRAGRKLTQKLPDRRKLFVYGFYAFVVGLAMLVGYALVR